MAQAAGFFLFSLIALGTADDFRTLRLSKIGDTKYQCIESGCSPSTIITVSYLRSCQLACISHGNCRTITFDPMMNQCEIFVDTPSRRGNMLAREGVLTMVAFNDQQPSNCK